MGSKEAKMPPFAGVLFLTVGWTASFLTAGYACQWLGSLHEYGEHTRAQVALAFGLCCIVATWIVAECARLVGPSLFGGIIGGNGFTPVPTVEPEVVGANIEMAASGEAAAQKGVSEELEAANGKPADDVPSGGFGEKYSLCIKSLVSSANVWRAAAEMTGILALIYLCDRTPIFQKGKKVYDKKQFWGCWALICVVALLTMRKLESTKPLQREQTDEWKGWMQLMFLMYHYFAEKEVYNAIRVYIAAYVFMTGFGNFSLYLKGKSFTVRRTLQMLFRLNFLGCVICIGLNNEYLLYYICAMHTLFTIFVILPLYFKPDWNSSTKILWGKIAVTAVCTVLIYDGPYFIFTGLFGTLPVIRPLFAFHDPLHPEYKDEMHEWHFRSGLDRFIWIFGMIFALNVPYFNQLIDWLMTKADSARHTWTAIVFGIVLVPSGVWVYYVFLLDKFTYNAVHPFTSFIPIAAFLLLRNLLPAFRQRYLWLFAYLGRYTLETYILQFHVWMKTTGNNGSPKFLLTLFGLNEKDQPAYYFVNFAVVSAVYLFLSIRICNLTIVLRDALIPEQLQAIAYNWTAVAGAAVICWGASYAFK
jgi:hypothetical protein